MRLVYGVPVTHGVWSLWALELVPKALSQDAKFLPKSAQNASNIQPMWNSSKTDMLGVVRATSFVPKGFVQVFVPK